MAQYSRVLDAVALITLQNPPVNALSGRVRQGIVDTVQRALADPKVKSVVICGQNGVFCGGADIREFGSPMTGPPLVPMIHAIEAADKPVVAAIEGVALGGGLELALGCHYRIAQAKAKVGLPEVTLGLLPAAGGTQRLPRLTGLPAALDLITTGRHITAAEALELSIVDRLTDHSAVDAAVKFAVSVADQSLDARRISSRPCPCPPDLDALFEAAMRKVRHSSRGATAPVACVQALRAAATLPYSQGMQREKDLMATLFTSGQARALQYNFFAQRAVARWRLPGGARWDGSKPRPISKTAVIGLGTMGRGITVCLAQAGLSVVAVEVQEKPLKEAKQAISGMLRRGAKRRGVAPALDLITYSQNLRAVADVDLVVEAVFEDLDLKTQIFQQLSNICKPGALLCTNTSGLNVDLLASQSRRPELVVGMHFFAPAHVMKLLEVVYGSRSSPEAVATAMDLGKKMGKVGVAVGNCRGFVGNRMLKPYMEQGLFLLEEGATPESVDGTLEEFGFAMGLFRMSDLSGIDVGWKVRKGDGLVQPGAESRVRQGRRYSPLGDLLCERGRFGQKTGRGWYQYDKGHEARPDPWLHRFLEEYRARHGLVARRIDRQEVLERCLYSLINEGFRILEEGIAAGPEDIDVVYTFGYGWPKHRGGPMFYAGMVGLAKVLERLEHYQQTHPDVLYMQPCGLLRRLVASGSPPVHKWREIIKNTHSKI
ncbi:peroxisomal bifunctional enzyme [Syngnathoides biaculeatus]|uniref:peroxisomal bifunctional enzyme n=1 Tax=Syngnathoides biaculeatus TaxID=300417 RepID=UPI002ADE746D|nr:peroxisomal bifunctional enzyme [Syngnathoides biaculeatus]